MGRDVGRDTTRDGDATRGAMWDVISAMPGDVTWYVGRARGRASGVIKDAGRIRVFGDGRRLPLALADLPQEEARCKSARGVNVEIWNSSAVDLDMFR